MKTDTLSSKKVFIIIYFLLFYSWSSWSQVRVIENGFVGIGAIDPQTIFNINTTYNYDGNSAWSAQRLSAKAINSVSPSNHAQYFIDNQLEISGTKHMRNVIGLHNLVTIKNSSTNNYVRSNYARVNMSQNGSAHSVALSSTHFEGNSNGTIKNFYGQVLGQVSYISQFHNTNSTIENTYGLFIGDLTNGNQINTPYSIYIEDTETINYIASDVGIGTESPTEMLDVVGNIKASGSVIASCGTLSCSDIRYKKNFSPIKNVKEKLQRINPTYYNWRQAEFPDMHFDDKTYLGFKAQEVEEQFPELVHTDDEGFKSVDYARMSVVLLQAVKEQQIENELMHEKNKNLEKRLSQLEEKINRLTVLDTKTIKSHSKEVSQNSTSKK